MSHIRPAKLSIKTIINENSILVGNGNFRFRICFTGKRCSVSASTSAKEFPFPFLFRKIPFSSSYFHSISIFLRKVSAPLSSLPGGIRPTAWPRRTNQWLIGGHKVKKPSELQQINEWPDDVHHLRMLYSNHWSSRAHHSSHSSRDYVSS
jgi:hypothetical protein